MYSPTVMPFAASFTLCLSKREPDDLHLAFRPGFDTKFCIWC